MFILIWNYMFRPIVAIIRFVHHLRGGLYIWVGGVDVEISMHQFPVALLSSANSYVQLNNQFQNINISISSWGCSSSPKKKYRCLYFRISYLFVHSYLQWTIGATGNWCIEISTSTSPIQIYRPPLNTLRTGAFKLFKCTFPLSKQFKSTYILCFFKKV